MTVDEAEKALKEGEFEGNFKKFVATETTATSWVKIDQRVSPFRFRAADGQIRIWTIMFEQRFDRPQSVEALSDLIVKKYGTPTESQKFSTDTPVKFLYHPHFTVDHQLSTAACQSGPDVFCPQKQYEAFERELRMPILEISITPRSIRARLADGEARAAGDEASQAAASAAQESKALNNTKNTKLGL
ncbi:hypothetical protein [Methylobacterium frigidaeris]|uniref:Uncharacterized protein n=1 Tax=Methylobacterium frigidaeris TaxID=2038277 RepID=A0AA37H7U7_9HYPH|nr:hypothetical protein [Methylobacterium frigidaeris]PIK73172.1 hypothetical protein CS379_09900 [Methylobacterium frigidaeris]GJD61023.1 hypothetical protein MPEAHAMD_1163 [Methylobacterium frigidaeris]